MHSELTKALRNSLFFSDSILIAVRIVGILLYQSMSSKKELVPAVKVEEKLAQYGFQIAYYTDLPLHVSSRYKKTRRCF